MEPHPSEPPPSPEGRREPSLAERISGSLPWLTAFVRARMGARLGARESVSDVVQSTCRELLRHASRFQERGPAAFEGWVRAAAENKLRNRARHWRAGRRAEPDAVPEREEAPDRIGETGRASESSTPSREAALREEMERLTRALKRLPDDYRRALQRSQIDGASYADLAREFGRTPEAVRKLVARAMARLAGDLEPSDPSR